MIDRADLLSWMRLIFYMQAATMVLIVILARLRK